MKDTEDQATYSSPLFIMEGEYENGRTYEGKCSRSHTGQRQNMQLTSELIDERGFDRDRSASPRPLKRDDSYRGGRDRSASPNGRMNSR